MISTARPCPICPRIWAVGPHRSSAIKYGFSVPSRFRVDSLCLSATIFNHFNPQNYSQSSAAAVAKGAVAPVRRADRLAGRLSGRQTHVVRFAARLRADHRIVSGLFTVAVDSPQRRWRRPNERFRSVRRLPAIDRVDAAGSGPHNADDHTAAANDADPDNDDNGGRRQSAAATAAAHPAAGRRPDAPAPAPVQHQHGVVDRPGRRLQFVASAVLQSGSV